MTAASEIVEKALFEIGAHSPFNQAPPESRDLAHDYLVDLLEELEEGGVNAGFVVPEDDDQNTDINEPEDTRQAVILLLAFRIAGPLRKELTDDLLTRKLQAEKEMNRKYKFIEPPDRPNSGFTGQGNWLLYQSRYRRG